MQDQINEVVNSERERCQLLCDALASRHERSAARIREEGSFWTRAIWPPFKPVKCVIPKWEQAARDVEAAAHSLRTVSRGIQAGWDPRKMASEMASLVRSPPPLPGDEPKCSTCHKSGCQD